MGGRECSFRPRSLSSLAVLYKYFASTRFYVAKSFGLLFFILCVGDELAVVPGDGDSVPSFSVARYRLLVVR